MKGKGAEAIAIGVISALALVFLASTCTASTVYVPDNYSTIQAAVNAASPGDTIIVRDGTYIENIEVYKSLTIRSENGADSTVIQAKDPDEHVFNVTADYVEISGFTVEGAYKGIYLYHADYCNISNNSCLKNDYGILLYYSNNTQITENTFINNSYGLYLASSSNNSIYHNNIINNAQQAYDDGSNAWDNGYPSGGNYWLDWYSPDNYAGINQNIRGFDFFVDYQYDVNDGTNCDRYPFILPDGWEKPLFIPNVLLVKFSASATNETINAIITQFETEIIEHISILDVYFLRILTTNRTESEVVYLFEKNTSVDFALLDYYVYEDHHLTHPNDPLYPQQWGLNNRGQRVINQVGTIDADIDAPQAWEHKTDCSDIVVAVIDSGVDLNHPDLAGNLWTNPAPTFGDLHGAEFSWNGTAVIRDGTPDDTSGHGTHCAGIIGAVGNNSMGVTGVNWGASIMALKAAGNLIADSAAVNYSIAQKRSGNANVKVISYSRSRNRVKTEKRGIVNQSQANRIVNRSRPLYSLMVDKTNAAGILFVCSAGNERGRYRVGSTGIYRYFDGNIDVSNFSAYPCKLTNQNLTCVAASDNQDRPASFSNWGNESVDLFAPGVDILSLCSNISKYGPLIYNDTDRNNVVSVNDTRLTRVSRYRAGSLVANGDSDVGFELTVFGPNVKHDEFVPSNRIYDSGEYIYLDADGSNNISVNDTRMTRVWSGGRTYSAGTVVATRDRDFGHLLVPFNNSEKYARVIYKSGTSMATPFVAGAVAHCWSLYPGKNHQEIKEMIKNNVEPRPGLKDKVKWGKNHDGLLRMCMGDDFGDAPDPFTAQSKYPTKTQKVGASHEDIGEEWLGADVSPEFDADKNWPYDVDREPNFNPSDTDHYDDGVTLDPSYIAGKKGKIVFTVSTENPFVNDSGRGRYDEFNTTKNPKKKIYVNVYFDWNADGDWDDTSEHIVTQKCDGATWWGGPGMKDCLGNSWSSSNKKKTITIEFVVPTNAKCISPWIRLRLDYGENVGKLKLYESDNSLNKSKGLAQFGEVEDYPPCIDAEKTVWNPATGKWEKSRVAKKCEDLKFKCTIHPKCCNLTNIEVIDILSKSLNYTSTQEITVDNVTIDVNTTVPGPDDTTYVTWTFPPAFKLKKCQTMTIIFDVHKKLEGCDKNTQIIKGKVCNKTFTVTSNTVDIFDINVNKTVWDPVTKKWVESRVAKKCENLKFKCVIHPKCCNLTNIAVKDVLSESLNYTGTQEITVDNETFNVTPTVEVEPGPDNTTHVTWTFPPDFKLEKCQNMVIHFFAHKVKCYDDWNTQIVIAKACNKTWVTVKSNTVDIIEAPGLTAKQLRNVVAEDEDYTIEGRATCVDYVDIVLIGPEGYYPIYDPLLDVLNGLTITSTPVTDDEFSENIIMGEGVDTGRWIAMVFSPGRDGEYGDLSVGAGNLAAGFDTEVFVVVETQDQIVEILKDHTVNVAGSDDLLESFTFKVESPFVKLNPIEPVAVEEPLVVTGTSNRQEGYMIVVTCKGPVELGPQSVKIENGTFEATFDTTGAKVGTYTVKAYDGDGHTDERDVVIYGAAVPPSEP